VGEIARYPRDPFVTEVLLGLLRPYGGERLNGVNAATFAEERGIRVGTGQRQSHKSFPSLLRVDVHDGDGDGVLRLAGTLFGRSNLRLVRAYDFNIDAIPEGPMLFCRNQDCPGIIGHLGTVLAEAGINIANMSVGRNEDGEALAVLNLDTEASDAVLEKLASRPEIRWVKNVRAR